MKIIKIKQAIGLATVLLACSTSAMALAPIQGSCASSDSPNATFNVKSHESTTGANDGAIKFTFEGDGSDFRTKIKFSIDGGSSYYSAVKDTKGFFTVTDLSPGNYQLSSAWVNDECPINLGEATVYAAPEAGSPQVTAKGGSGTIKFTFNDDPNQSKIKFSLDGGNTYSEKAKDAKGKYKVSGLAAGQYTVFAQWGDGSFPTFVDDVTVQPGPVLCEGNDIPTATAVAVAETIEGANDGSITFTFPGDQGGERTKILFSLDGGVNYLPAVKDKKGSFTVNNLEPKTYDLFSMWKGGDCPTDLTDVTVQQGDPVVQTTEEVVYEAESAVLTGSAEIFSNNAASNGQAVGFINNDNASVSVGTVNAGNKLTLRYATQQNGNTTILIDNVAHTLPVSSTGSWTASYATVSLDVEIAQDAFVETSWVNGDAAINLDYIAIEEYTSSEPAISLSAPTTVVLGDTLSVTPNVRNWVVEEGGRHFHYFINGEDQGPRFNTDPIEITGLAVGTHTISVQLAEADHSFINADDMITVEVIEAPTRVLVFSHTTGFRHSSIDSGKNMFQNIANSQGYQITISDNSAEFDNNLANYDVVVFNNTTGDILNAQQETNFRNWLEAGGGFLGVHSAVDTEANWTWYHDEVLGGARFIGHPDEIQTADLILEEGSEGFLDHVGHAGDTWSFRDEWYMWDVDLRLSPNLDVVARLDRTSYATKQLPADGDHPIIFTNQVEAGLIYYTNQGHRNETYNDANFILQITNAINWLANP